MFKLDRKAETETRKCVKMSPKREGHLLLATMAEQLGRRDPSRLVSEKRACEKGNDRKDSSIAAEVHVYIVGDELKTSLGSY